MVSYFKIDYSLKNSKGETPDFIDRTAHAYIAAPTADATVEDLRDKWNSWDVEILKVSDKLEMTDEEYNNN